MSRNFALLQQAAKGDLLAPTGVPAPSSQALRSPALGRKTGHEEIGTLAQRLSLLADQPGGPRVIAFSGIAYGDRSSWIATRTAEALAAQTESPVCIVDAHSWSPQAVRLLVMVGYMDWRRRRQRRLCPTLCYAPFHGGPLVGTVRRGERPQPST